ncbi:30S ribosomal protein S9 [Candidatus Woesearchaeota archaeon]|nr:30S ribosomal protein S9 [Candidatus Woesearchaeota archaeon]
MAKPKVSHASGKRKSAVARATVRLGKGILKINSIPLHLYEPEIARLRIKEALAIAGPKVTSKVNIKVNVKGGGWSSQTEAVRLAIAKALVDYTDSEKLKKEYLDYDRHLLVADTRRKETRKPMTHSRARAKRQKSYR